MIAALVLVARYLAARTHFGIVAFLPLKEFLVMLTTLLAWVIKLTALQADHCSALTCNFLLENACFPHKSITVGARAPLELWVHVDVDVEPELQVLLVDLF